MNSKRKGKRIELEAASFLRSIGYADAARGCQFKGSPDSPDIACKSLGVHVEVKGDQSIGLGTKALNDALDQAYKDAGNAGNAIMAKTFSPELRPYAVLWKLDRKPWNLTYYSEPGVFATVTGEGDIGRALGWIRTRAAKVTNT